MKPPFVVRQGTIDDAEAVCGLYRWYAEYRYQLGLGDPLDYRLSPERYRQYGFGDNPAFKILVSEKETTIVGYLMYCVAYDIVIARPYLLIEGLLVNEHFRGLGVGRLLVNHAKQACRELGGSRMVASIDKNIVTQRIYEHIGGTLDNDRQYMLFVC